MDDTTDRVLTAGQVEVLRHPARTRIFFSLGPEGATVSQLSHRLRTHKGNVAHHLRMLRSVGLVEISRTATVRGGTEQYWTSTVRRVRGPRGDRDAAAAFLATVADEVTESTIEPLLHLRHIRLDQQRARALQQYLDHLVGDLEPGPTTEPTYGVLVGLFGGH